jgi:hypothetical protein
LDAGGRVDELATAPFEKGKAVNDRAGSLGGMLVMNLKLPPDFLMIQVALLA